MPTPMSKYPRIPRILGQSWDCPGMGNMLTPMSKYLRIPKILKQTWDCSVMASILGQSWDCPRMTHMTTIQGLSWDTHMSTPTFKVSQDSQDTRTILGLSQDGQHADPPCPSIPGFQGYSDNPGIVPGWPTCRPPRPSIPTTIGYISCKDFHTTFAKFLNFDKLLHHSCTSGVLLLK